VLRRSVSYAVRDIGRAVGVLARQIGGLRTLRDHPGTGRDPLQPVPAAVQREALDVLAKGVFAADSLRISPALQRKLAPNFDERGESLRSMASVSTDFSFDSFVGQLRKALLAQLMTDGVATRILESAEKLPAGEAFRLSELYGRLSTEIWSELSAKGDIPGPRRELQRDHVNRLAAQMLRPSSSRADTRSLLRVEAQTLLKRLLAAQGRAGLSAESRAHLADSTETLSGTALVLGLVITLTAQLREREAQARSQALQFELERSRLEKQAVDARLALLQAQIEPHFLFNTLANVQALVEAGSPRAPAVLQSLIAYLRAAVPRLHAARATLARNWPVRPTWS
jgi:hypothetical protein